LLSCGIGQGSTEPGREGEEEEETLIRGKISVPEPSQGVSSNIGGDVGLTTFSISRYNANSRAADRKKPGNPRQVVTQKRIASSQALLGPPPLGAAGEGKAAERFVISTRGL
jgi:hypothetical protein